MVAETASRLRFHDIAKYRYVGLGSIHFADFKLMHRSLGISSMISIESVEKDKDRFEFNKPYSPIKMEYGKTEDVLPNLDWDLPSIIWLDYDDQLSISKIIDVDLVIRQAASGSLFLISINAEVPSPSGTQSEETLLDRLRRMVGPERVDSAWRDQNLQGWEASKVYYRILSGVIEAALASLNALIEDGSQHRVWRQVLNIGYKDGARMMTIGGVIYEARDESYYLSGAFERLSFFRDQDASYRIEVPSLTLKEMAYLEMEALDDPEGAKGLPWLNPAERKQFLKLYRYFPSFVPAEF